MKHGPLIFAFAITLSGCDATKDLGAQVAKTVPAQAPMTLVIHSGYNMLVDGREAPIFGKDKCPPAKTNVMTSIIGTDSNDDKRSCIVIAPDTERVSVTVGFRDGPTDEVWTVERSGDRIMLRRADGSYLAPAK